VVSWRVVERGGTDNKILLAMRILLWVLVHRSILYLTAKGVSQQCMNIF